jgi:L-amino acid N-acyltransferase
MSTIVETTKKRQVQMNRHATAEDVPGILEIYNEVIANSTAIYTETPVTLDNRLAWMEDRLAKNFPVLVEEDAQGIAGFASFGDFRVWPCYRFTVEHSVHVRADVRGTGIGGNLLKSLIPIAAEQGKHVMIAGVDASNTNSIRFHEKLGFKKVAHFEEVGFKFGRWLDLVFLQISVAQTK